MNPVLGKEATVESGGTTYKLARMDRAVLDGFMSWAETKIPSPLDLLAKKLDQYPKAVQDKLLDKAMREERVPLTFHSREAQALLQTTDGAVKLVHVLLLRHQPHITFEQAKEIFDRGAEEHGSNYWPNKLLECQGQAPLTESELQRAAMEQMGFLPTDDEKKS